jgi:hypothetical protein
VWLADFHVLFSLFSFLLGRHGGSSPLSEYIVKVEIYAYPKAQNESKFVFEISSTHSGGILCVTFSPLISSVTPVNCGLNIISFTALVRLDIGVLVILAKRLPSAIFVAVSVNDCGAGGM